MKRCPGCNSRRFKEKNQPGEWRCERCGFIWLDPKLHKVFSPHGTVSPKGQRWGGVDGNATALNDNHLTLIDYHNIVYKFQIVQDNPLVHLPQARPMRGWIQEWEEVNGVKFQRTPHSIIIFLNRRLFRPGTQGIEEEALILVKRQAQSFQERYQIVLDMDHPEAVRKEVKLMEGFRSPEQFQGNLVKCVYPDGRIEFKDPDQAVTHTQNFIEGLALENRSDLILEAMAKWNQNFELHYEVLKKQAETLEAIQKSFNHAQFPEGNSRHDIEGLWSALMNKIKPQLDFLEKTFKGDTK